MFWEKEEVWVAVNDIIFKNRVKYMI
jgi:hypothetical protein